jgi:hypothetical protein
MKFQIVEQKDNKQYIPKYTKGTILQYIGETERNRDGFKNERYYIITSVHWCYYLPDNHPNTHQSYTLHPISKPDGKIYKKDFEYRAYAVDNTLPFIFVQ